MDEDYRARIYGQYVKSRERPLAPADVEGLAPRVPYLRQLVARCFPADRDAAVLDVGCGHGALVYVARLMGYRNIVGVDGSPEQVAAAGRLGVPGVVEGDLVETLAAREDCSLDVVVAFDVIEHFTREELLPFVDHVYRVLRPGGRWVVHVPNGDSPFVGAIRYGDITHELAFTRTSLSQLLISSGFHEVAYFEDTPVVHGVKSAVRWGLWKGVRGALRLYLAAETGDTGRDRLLTQNFLAVAMRPEA